MSLEANSKPLFNFSAWPTAVLVRRSDELIGNILTGAHGEERQRSLMEEANQARFELIYRREEDLAPAALALFLHMELFTDRQPAAV